MTTIRCRRLAVVILTLDQREKTLTCLDSLARDTSADKQILVWDNGSQDGTAEAVANRFPDVTVHVHPTNLGVASGRNAGAQLAIDQFDPTHILFLDNDMVITSGFCAALLQAFDVYDNLGQAQAKLRFMDEPEILNDGGGCRVSFWRGYTTPVGFREVDRGQRDEPRPCVACGGAMMVRRGVFEELGGFDASFDPFGPEDIDFSFRLQRAGYLAMYVPAAMAYHEVSHSFGAGYTEVYAQNKVKHWIRLLRRHANLAQKLGFFCVGAPFVALRLITRETRRGNFGAIRGVVRGGLDLLRSEKTSSPSTHDRGRQDLNLDSEHGNRTRR